MHKYWFKKHGRGGFIPVNWKGWALFAFIIGLLVQTSHLFNDVLFIFLYAGGIAAFGYWLMNRKTNPETFSKEKDNVWKTEIWGGFIGLLGAMLVFALVLFIQKNIVTVSKTNLSPTLENTNEKSIKTDSSIKAVMFNTEQTYINEKYGFKITPPKDWIVDESGENNTVVFFLNKIADNENGYKWQGSINIGIFGGNSGFTLKDIISSFKQSSQEWVSNLVIVSESQLKISDYDAFLISETFVNEGHKFRSYRLFILKGDNLYNISGVVLDSTWKQHKQDITDSISSFSFLR
ncbi:MAG TPA: PsbP-related protein [Candidatus Andersenbacteria bacterium]|nr:PsbP-related protein [Candidatus Andersenbacteria bacterium]